MLGSVPRSCQHEAVPGGRGEEFCGQQPLWLPCESVRGRLGPGSIGEGERCPPCVCER